eukprot:8546224-Alexandrium_andersonii.AAC.1
MSASLVGSEMCIRDSLLREHRQGGGLAAADGVASLTEPFEQMTVGSPPPVSNLRGLGVVRAILGAHESQENA